MPRVSIIIPAHNAEAHLPQTLSSIETQTFEDWEIVLCDDASTDRTSAVAAHLEPRVTVIRSEENVGPAAARNLAISRASGELLAFLDSDDYWLPEYLERQTGLYERMSAERKRPGIIACNAWILSDSGFLEGTYLDYVGLDSDITVARALRSNPFFVGSVCPRRAVHEAGCFSADLRSAEDYDLWLRILELGYSGVVSREPLAVYRIRGRSLSADPVTMARGTQVVLGRALARGNLTRREARIARRELRRQRAIEEIATPTGLSYRAMVRHLPLLALVAVEHPCRWPSFARALTDRGRRLWRFGDEASQG